MAQGELLTETAAPLYDALRAAGFEATDYHTGGGVFVCDIDLGFGRHAWLTREDEWLLGFYNFASSPEDEGVCVQLILPPLARDTAPAVAEAVRGILSRMGVVAEDAS